MDQGSTSTGRKSVSSIPFLTGKSVVPIVNFLYREEVGIKPNGFNDESVLLAGILFCGLWREGTYDDEKNKTEWKNVIFESADDDPTECLRLYLEENNIRGDSLQDLMETSFEKGYIQEHPPFYGKVEIRYSDGSLMDQYEKEEEFAPMDSSVLMNFEILNSGLVGEPVGWYQVLLSNLEVINDHYYEIYRGGTDYFDSKFLEIIESKFGEWFEEGIKSPYGNSFILVITD